MITIILIAVVILVLLLVLIIARRPDRFVVSRSAVIHAEVPVVFAEVNDLHRWEAWSPWVKLDPNAKLTYEGPSAGVGASQSWDSSSGQVGAGKMTIVESRTGEFIGIRLEFFRPFVATNTAEFSFAAENSGTRVTWSMHGINSFVGKAVSLFIDCDKIVGEQFEKGLANLNSIVGTTS